MSIVTNVLVSQSTQFDLIFGLDACVSIGATIYHDFFRYYVVLNGKERFGKIPIYKYIAKTK